MKIAILGTSNSILTGGWTDGLRAAMPKAEIANYSIGGSPGIQFGWAMDQDFSQFDLVFFDSVPNDEKLGESVGDFDYVDQITFQIMSTVAAQTRLIALGFCLDSYLTSPSRFYSRRQDLARACSAQFIGMRDITLSFGRQILGPDRPLFEAEAHPDRIIAKTIGLELGKVLPRFLADSPKVSGAKNYHSRFSSTDLTKEIPETGKIVTKSNRLLKMDFLDLKPGQLVSIGNKSRCIGFYVNKYGTRGSLNLHGPDGVVRKDLWHHVTEDLFEALFIPLTGGMRLDAIELSHRWRGGRVVLPRGQMADYSDPNAQVQLSKLVFWDDQGPEATCAPASDFDCFWLHNLIVQGLEASFGPGRTADEGEDEVDPEMFLEAGRYLAAGEAYRRLAQRNPSDVAVWKGLGHAYTMAKRPVDAIKAFEQWTALAPHSAEAHAEFGRSLARVRNWSAAAESFRQSVQLDGSQPDIWMELGRTLLLSENSTEAVNALRCSVAFQDHPSEADLLLGKALWAVRDRDGALVAYRAYVDARPRDVIGWVQLGRTLGSLGELVGAEEALCRAAELEPDNAIIASDLERVRRKRGA